MMANLFGHQLGLFARRRVGPGANELFSQDGIQRLLLGSGIGFSLCKLKTTEVKKNGRDCGNISTHLSRKSTDEPSQDGKRPFLGSLAL
jgi:hypothetical protein